MQIPADLAHRRTAIRSKSYLLGINIFLAKIPRRKVYRGSSEETEQALAYVIHVANKGLTHATRSFLRHDESSGLLEIAFSDVNALMVNYFFDQWAWSHRPIHCSQGNEMLNHPLEWMPAQRRRAPLSSRTLCLLFT